MPKIREMDAGLQAGERLRETTIRPPMHQSREAEAVAEYDLRPEEIRYDTGPRNMPEIPARDGYVQRWVRMADPNMPGDNNFRMRYVDGWRPRPLETIPEMFRIFSGQTKGAAAPTDMQIGQNILCEMPIALWQRRMATKQALNKRFRDIADETVSKINRLGGGIVGGYSDSSQNVTVGRVPATMAG